MPSNPGIDPEERPSSFKMAYVLLWFPLASETFIFKEIEELANAGLKITVFTMYGKHLKGCSDAMKKWTGPVFRMGIKRFPAMTVAFFRALFKRPAFVRELLRKIFFRKMRNLESLLENLWCFYAGFLLAEKCLEEKISLIHAAWANGPATAAWVASELSGIPFAFTGRAGDIYPQDGLLPEKSAAARFIRANNQANVQWLQSFCGEKDKNKVKLVYNGLTLPEKENWKGGQGRPPAILAIGRFARTKGFPELLTAMARLKRENFPVRLTIIGDGAWRGKLERLRKRLGLETMVEMPGFLPNDRLKEYFENYDVLVVPSVVYANGDRDGIPNVIMEALSSGMPVIASDVCGISEVIRDGETGLLVPQRDTRALAGAIRRMLSDPEKAGQMATKGSLLVRSMFNTGANAEKLKNLYLASASNDNA